MAIQATEQNQQSSLLEEIFIAPSKQVVADRFSAEAASAPCREKCSGECGSIAYE